MNPNIALALQISFDLLKHATDLQALLGKAAQENRDITSEELASLSSATDISAARLDAAIANADAGSGAKPNDGPIVNPPL